MPAITNPSRDGPTPTLVRRLRVRLSAIKFPESVLDESKVAALQSIFNDQILDRSSNAIPADIADVDIPNLDHENSILNIDDENIIIKCLNGKHRVAAARKTLSETDQWWFVDVFRLTLQQRTELIGGASNTSCEHQLGLTLRKALLEDSSFEKDLNDHPGILKVVHSLKKRPEVWNKLVALLPYEGLWTGKFHIGNFKAIHYVDGLQPELLRYLGTIYDFWSALPEGSQDPETVSSLHLLCPQVDRDRSTIISMFGSGLLFNKLGPDQRQHALETVLNSNHSMINTMWSFFSTLKFIGVFNNGPSTVSR